MNKKIITGLLFCISFAAQAGNFTFTMKNKEGKPLNEVKLYGTNDSPAVYSQTTATNYISSCEEKDEENNIIEKAEKVTLISDKVVVGRILNITEQTIDSVRLSYDISELISIKTVSSLGCLIQLPDVARNSADINLNIKSKETVLVGEFQGNQIFLYRD